MYCKKCGKVYPENKKVCKNCGLALTRGKPQSSDKNDRRRRLIIAGCSFVVLAVILLMIGIPGMITQKLKGTWYDQNGVLGTVEFKDNGKADWMVLGINTEYQYTYDGQKGKLIEQGKEYDFTCDGKTMILQDTKFTKDVVKQYYQAASPTP